MTLILDPSAGDSEDVVARLVDDSVLDDDLEGALPETRCGFILAATSGEECRFVLDLDSDGVLGLVAKACTWLLLVLGIKEGYSKSRDEHVFVNGEGRRIGGSACSTANSGRRGWRTTDPTRPGI